MTCCLDEASIPSRSLPKPARREGARSLVIRDPVRNGSGYLGSAQIGETTPIWHGKSHTRRALLTRDLFCSSFAHLTTGTLPKFFLSTLLLVSLPVVPLGESIDVVKRQAARALWPKHSHGRFDSARFSTGERVRAARSGIRSDMLRSEPGRCTPSATRHASMRLASRSSDHPPGPLCLLVRMEALVAR